MFGLSVNTQQMSHADAPCVACVLQGRCRGTSSRCTSRPWAACPRSWCWSLASCWPRPPEWAPPCGSATGPALRTCQVSRLHAFNGSTWRYVSSPRLISNFFTYHCACKDLATLLARCSRERLEVPYFGITIMHEHWVPAAAPLMAPRNPSSRVPCLHLHASTQQRAPRQQDKPAAGAYKVMWHLIIHTWASRP